MKIDIIAGARPNFIKIAPIIDEINILKKGGENICYRLIHTGQHYDINLSDLFFKQLNIPQPDLNLCAGGGTQAEQTASIMVAYEKLLLSSPSDLCLVVGDVTSTMACAIVAQKLQIPVAHVEAGIRSGDWSMPEEINRLVTDSITNFFFTTTIEASQTILNSGVSKYRVFFVGNTMIDTLMKQKPRFRKPHFWDELDLKKSHFFVITLHRPANVDQVDKLKDLLDEIIKNTNGLPLIFPAHPRTAKILKSLVIEYKQLYIFEPLGYLEFNFLVENSLAVITDSGGITEETTVMGVPCITLRDNTERPETITVGTNELIGTNPKAIKPTLKKLFDGEWKKGKIPELWDGNSANRIVSILKNLPVGR
jgi:UDP-N-acetylglucosamine 2-epimerase (non-hydrolysing)